MSDRRGHDRELSSPGDVLAYAAHDYRWLLDRGYPDQQALQLCGNRFRLSRTERGMLYRGVFAGEASRPRKARLVTASLSVSFTAGWSRLVIDGYNVLFTVWNYLAGRPLVRATDGFVRDIGGTRSRLPHDQRFTRLAELLCSAVASTRFGRAAVFLDAQLPWSRDQSAELVSVWARVGVPEIGFAAEVHPAVDAVVAARTDATIATSDTGIIDRCSQPVLDLGGRIVTTAFAASPVDMAKLCTVGVR